nr:PQQ-binding-like beta-propeller repeat protein [uncultured Mucilaginibacter sp.]
MNSNFYKKASRRTWRKIGLAALVATVVVVGCMSRKDAMMKTISGIVPFKTWTTYGGSADMSRYTELEQINKKNVNQLEVAWHYPTMDNTAYTFNPIVIDTIMYLMGKNNSLIAVNAVNGKDIWIHANLAGITRKGLNYWESKDRKDRRLIFSLNNTLQEIDALTGKSILSFGNNGYISLKNDLNRDPESVGRGASGTPGQLFDDIIILGSAPGEGLFSAPGHIRAYNVITGKLAWVFHTIPEPGEFGYETWPKDAYKYIGGVNCWGEMSTDTKRGIVYIPLGSPTYDYYGADRIGANLFSDCILALDARTGKRLWHYQTVHHDIWDYDITAAPQLITVDKNGKSVDAVAIATKQGFLYVFDRVTGEPLFPIEERPVPKSEVAGEQSWPTQPHSTLPPFTKQIVTVADLNPYWSPGHADTMKRRVAAAKSGLFLPLSDKYEVIAMPGAVGGANWGNTASNPKKGIVYVASMNHGSIYKLTKTPSRNTPMSAAAMSAAQTAYVQNCQSCHGANREGAVGPPINNIAARINLDAFKTLIATGKGQMPPFAHIDETTLTGIYRFVTGAAAGGPPAGGPGRGGFGGPARVTTPPTGPVVATGGAPDAVGFNAQRSAKIMTDYPEGVPNYDRYTTPYGLSNSDLVSPPWSTITAYDLNKGLVLWKKPIGQDGRIPLKTGQEEMGIPIGTEHRSMLVTSTGILFATARGGDLYAFDAENGKLLWRYRLPKDSEGGMTTYQVNGKQYLVVPAMAAFSIEAGARAKIPGLYPPGYLVFALPDKKK